MEMLPLEKSTLPIEYEFAHRWKAKHGPFLDRLQTLKASFSEPGTDVIDAFLLIPFGQKQRSLDCQNFLLS